MDQYYYNESFEVFNSHILKYLLILHFLFCAEFAEYTESLWLIKIGIQARKTSDAYFLKFSITLVIGLILFLTKRFALDTLDMNPD